MSMKKIISFILLLLLTVQAVPVFAEYDVTDADEALLYDLGILPDGYEDSVILTRGMFAAFCARLATSKPKDIISENVIADLDDDNDYKDEILNAYVFGIIELDTGNKFYPNENIKFDDAVLMLSALIGGRELSKKAEMAANSAQILGVESVPRPAGGYLDFKTYKQLMTKIIHVNIFKSEKPGVFDNFDNETVLSGYLNLTEVKGIVTQCAYTGISGKSNLLDNQLVIKSGNTELTLTTKLTKDEIYSLLGRNVRAYYSDVDGEDTAISVRCTGRDEVLVISGSDIEKNASEKNKIAYTNQQGKRKFADIKASADVIYNRSALSDYTLADLTVNDGKLELISTDASGAYDLVKVSEYDYTIVGSVNAEKQYIIDLYKLNNLDLEKDETFVTADGTECEVSSLKKNDLIVSEKDKSGKITAAGLVANRIVGKVESFDESEVTIDGEKYKIGEYYNRLAAMENRPKDFAFIKVGATFCALADENDNVVALIEMKAQEKIRYAYLIKLSGEDEKAKARILNTSGEIEILDFADKVSVDGKRVKKSEVIKRLVASHGKTFVYAEEGYKIGSVVRIRTDENKKIDYVDTIAKDEYTEGEETMERTFARSSLVWSPDASSFSGKARLNQSSIIFQVPSNLDEVDSFAVVNSSSLSFGTYDVELYNVKRNGLASTAVVYVNSKITGFIDGWDPIYLIKNSTKVFGDDEEIYDVLHAYSLNGEVDLIVDNKFDIDISSVNPGDIIRVGKSYNGRVNFIEPIMSVNKTDKPFKSSNNFTGSYWFWFGKVVYAEDNMMYVDFSEDDTEKLYFDVTEPFASRCHYVYNCETGSISTITIPNILGFENYNDGDWVLLYSWKGKIKDVVIYRNFKTTK